MANKLSANRLVRNEQILRNRNMELKKDVKMQLTDRRKSKGVIIGFICECSALDCTETVSMTIKAYETLHKRQDCFVLAKGHQTEAIEEVLVDIKEYSVVAKDELAA